MTSSKHTSPHRQRILFSRVFFFAVLRIYLKSSLNNKELFHRYFFAFSFFFISYQTQVSSSSPPFASSSSRIKFNFFSFCFLFLSLARLFEIDLTIVGKYLGWPQLNTIHTSPEKTDDYQRCCCFLGFSFGLAFLKLPLMMIFNKLLLAVTALHVNHMATDENRARYS